MIFLNGVRGGLGRYVREELEATGTPYRLLRARLEAPSQLAVELDAAPTPRPGSAVTLIHLAAMVSVAECEAHPERARMVNVDGAEACVAEFNRWADQKDLRPSFVYVSTGHVYAPPLPAHPVTEVSPLAPKSVYARTKLQAEKGLGALASQIGFPLVIARVFGLLAPGQPSHYVLPSLIERVRRMDVRSIPGLSNVRDYLDARDVARHLHQLASVATRRKLGTTAVVNVCSGEETSIRTLLHAVVDQLAAAGTIEGPLVRSLVGEAPARPTDVAWLVGSPTTLIEMTGGPPRTIPLDTTVRDAIAAA